ncbi:putative bifunctional diguanylate cyclase/phosphodiesterase [Mycobacterium sp. pV006]|uniref:putative bifunctional diguanylate cyclase/phosphodiesterase n=1 Tax=Mycobacterium sp. pV006 TaxID=3238983 RepID=UPI00351AC67B
MRPPAVQLWLLVIITGYLVTTLPGMRPQPGYSWWLDGIGQNLAWAAATVLCVVRTPATSPDRMAWRIIAAGLLSSGAANIYYLWFVQPTTVLPTPSVWAGLWLAFYPCSCLGLILLTRPRMRRVPLGRVLDGVVVGLGTATVGAALVVPQLLAYLGPGFTRAAATLVYPIADLVLLALVVFSLSSLRWRVPPAMWWLAAGLVVFAATNSLFVMRLARGDYQPGGLLDGSWVLAALLVAVAPGFPSRPLHHRPPPTWAPLAAPLLAACAAIGVLAAAGYISITPAARWLAVATLLAALARLAVAFFEARSAGVRAREARTDELTGLLNRRGFYERASEVLAQGCTDDSGFHCALLLFDLDHFKDVNDSLGHAAGDELLRMVASRLAASVEDTAVVGRLGGDEFVVLLPDARVDAAVALASTLIAVLQEGLELDGVEIRTDASVGIAVAGQHGRELTTLLRHADIAMYRAKHSRAGVLVYAADQTGQSTTRAGMEMLAQLRRAIELGELTVHYQPKVALPTREICGAEALVRWPHPRLGMLYPDQFLPLARHHSLMDAMTEFVIDRALTDVRRWSAHGHPLPVSVNLPAPFVTDRGLPERITETLARHQVPAALLAVEITEEFMLGHLEQARAVLDQIWTLGVAIAIDDFGTGYSALSYLRDLPIDEVKLDRSFIASVTDDADAAAIVRAVIDLSHTLGLITVAEGVETSDAVAALESFGCDVVQGHHFSPPVDAAEMQRLLVAQDERSGMRSAAGSPRQRLARLMSPRARRRAR